MKLPQIPYYHIDSPIDAGGTAEVFKAIDLRSGFLVAIKALFPSRAKDDFIMQKFREEANHYLYLEHPNITKLVDFVEQDNQFYIVMEYIEGIQLDEYLHTVTGPMPDERLVPIFCEILKTIEFLHNKDLLHLDIKPGNIMIVDHSKVKILDMGISAKLSDQNNNLRTCGSPSYMSPEQISKGVLGKYTDIFALGITLFKMSTGDLPFKGKHHTDIFNNIINSSLPKAADYYPGINPKIQAILEKALGKNSNDRYQNCGDFIRDVKAIL